MTPLKRSYLILALLAPLTLAGAEDSAASSGITDWTAQIFSLYMSPLWLCSILLLALIIDRARALSRRKIVDEAMFTAVADAIAEQDMDRAIDSAMRSETVAGTAWKQGLQEVATGGVGLKDALTDASLLALKPLKRNLQGIATIAVISPLIGLLGTIIGMIMTFDQIAIAGGADKAALATGIAVALFTTAGGMLVAIPAIIGGRFFNARLTMMAEEIEAAINRVNYRHIHASTPADARADDAEPAPAEPAALAGATA